MTMVRSKEVTNLAAYELLAVVLTCQLGLAARKSSSSYLFQIADLLFRPSSVTELY